MAQAIVRHVGGLRLLQELQWWQPVAGFLNKVLSFTSAEVLPSISKKGNDGPQDTLLVADSLRFETSSLATRSCTRQVAWAIANGGDSIFFRRQGSHQIDTNFNLGSRQLSTLPDISGVRLGGIDSQGPTRSGTSTESGAPAIGDVPETQPPERKGNKHRVSVEERFLDGVSDQGSVGREEAESDSLPERSGAPDGEDEELERLEWELAEVARKDGGLLPAGERQEKDPDPERDYFHVLKLDEIKRILETVRGRDVEVMYVREKCDFTDYMVVVTGRSERHIRAMAEAVVRELSRKCQEIMEGLTPAVEGEPGQEWLLVDAGNIIVHFFTEEERDYYKLEEIWGGTTPSKKRYGPYGELLE